MVPFAKSQNLTLRMVRIIQIILVTETIAALLAVKVETPTCVFACERARVCVCVGVHACVAMA